MTNNLFTIFQMFPCCILTQQPLLARRPSYKQLVNINSKRLRFPLFLLSTEDSSSGQFVFPAGGGL